MKPTQFVADTQLLENQNKAKALGVNIPAPQIAPTISANDLLKGSNPIDLTGTFTQPKATSYRGIVDNIRNDITTRENDYKLQQQKIAESEALFGDVANTSFKDVRQGLNSEYGLPDSLKELKDINLQLSDYKTDSELTKTKIQGAAGQTIAQAQRAVTQEDREQAVRSAGLAARAAVLTDNIETARTLINDAMNDAYADRETKLKITEKQLDRAYQVADENQKTILDQRREQMKVEMEQINEVKTAVSEAVLNGATQSEIAQLTDPNMSDEEKVALAQGITARGANQMRQLEIAQKQASIANTYDQINARRQALADKIASATTEQEKAVIQKTAASEQSLSIKALAEELKNSSGLGAAVGVGFKKSVVGSLPFVSGDAINGTPRADFEAKAERLANQLTLDNLDLMKGVLTDRDVNILASAASNLGNFSMSEAEYLKEVDRIIQTAERAITNNGITSEQAVFWGVLGEGEDETVNSIWNAL